MRPVFRKYLWHMHSWLGLTAGLGLLLIGFSGSLLVFRDEINALIAPSQVRVSPSPDGRLPLDSLLRRIEAQLPDFELTGWHLHADDPHAADELYLIRHGSTEWLTTTLDPYTGNLLAGPHLGTSTFTGWLLSFHYTFRAGDAGTLLAGLLAVALLALGLSGFWLHRDFWKRLPSLRLRRGWRILFSDTHRLVGVSSAALNLLLGFTGAWWNLKHVADEWFLDDHHHEQAPFSSRLYSQGISLDRIVSDAPSRLEGFRTNFISLPSNPSAPAVILWGAVEPRPFWRDAYGSTLFYDPQTGAHRSTSDIREAPFWKQVTSSFKPLHFGAFGGWPIRLLWAAAGLAPGVLAVSGFFIWRQRRKRSAVAAAQEQAATLPAQPATFLNNPCTTADTVSKI